MSKSHNNSGSSDNQKFIETLIQEISLLKAQNEVLNARIELMQTYKFTFDKYLFLRNPTVDFLSLCCLDRETMIKALRMLEYFDFPCAKYIIDRWMDRLFDYDDETYDNDDRLLIQLVCEHGREDAIMYTLDIYDKKNLDISGVESENDSPMRVLCRRGFVPTINRIIDIYLNKNLDLRRGNKYGNAPIHILCIYGVPQTIDRIIDIYLDKNFDLRDKNKEGYTPLYLLCVYGPLQSITRLVYIYLDKGYNLWDSMDNAPMYGRGHGFKCEYNYLHVVCAKREMPIIKFMIDVFVERNLSLDGTRNQTLESMLKKNDLLKKNSDNIDWCTCMCNYLNEKF